MKNEFCTTMFNVNALRN